MKIFDDVADVSKKLCYIALAALLVLTLADRAEAEEVTDVAVPAAVTVQTETDDESGMTRVTVYIRTFIKDVQDKYRNITATDSEEAESPKTS
tara:strand:+ start:576 stop:854 length:279 start_codon:yes stop_codon:yes gene_type:complete